MYRKRKYGGGGGFRQPRKRRAYGSRYYAMPAGLGRAGRGKMSYGRSWGRRRMLNQRTGGLLGVEVKFYDTYKAETLVPSTTTWASAEFNPAAAVSSLNAIAQGDGPTNRDGNKIVVKSLFLQGLIRRAAAEDIVSPQTDCQVFLAIVLDTQTNGVELNSEDVYSLAEANAYQIASPIRNMSNSTRFKVLATRVVNMDLGSYVSAVAGTAWGNVGKSQRFQIALKNLNLKVNFKTAVTTADVAGISDNGLFLIANSTYSAAYASYTCRLRFVG